MPGPFDFFAVGVPLRVGRGACHQPSGSSKHSMLLTRCFCE